MALRYGYAKYLRDGLKNATFVAFTGIPISTGDKDTRAVFGDYVSIYDIEQAVTDKATVPIYYESRQAKLELAEDTIPTLDEEVDELTEDEEEGARERIKTRWAALERLVGAAPRIAKIAEDLVLHYETRDASTAGKAMVVCMSRDVCVQMYDALVKLRRNGMTKIPTKVPSKSS